MPKLCRIYCLTSENWPVTVDWWGWKVSEGVVWCCQLSSACCNFCWWNRLTSVSGIVFSDPRCYTSFLTIYIYWAGKCIHINPSSVKTHHHLCTERNRECNSASESESIIWYESCAKLRSENEMLHRKLAKTVMPHVPVKMWDNI